MQDRRVLELRGADAAKLPISSPFSTLLP
jgi:hypothetical protein